MLGKRNLVQHRICLPKDLFFWKKTTDAFTDQRMAYVFGSMFRATGAKNAVVTGEVSLLQEAPSVVTSSRSFIEESNKGFRSCRKLHRTSSYTHLHTSNRSSE